MIDHLRSQSVEDAAAPRRIFAAIELSKLSWLVAIKLPTIDKVSVYRVSGGDIEGLIALLEKSRGRVGDPVEICSCYEAGW